MRSESSAGTPLAMLLCALASTAAAAAADPAVAPAVEHPATVGARPAAPLLRETTPGQTTAPVAPPAALGLDLPIQLSGYFWVDTGYMKRTNAQTGQYDQSAQYMQGRFVLAAAYQREVAGLVGLAKVELVGFVNEYTKSQYEPHTLDAYVRIGQRRWDLQVGRFLAWEVYYRGQGIELYTAEEAGALGGPLMYLLDFTRGLKNEAGQLAFHLFPLDFLSVEVAGVYGQESGQNNLGVRPVADLKLGGLEVIGGYEYFKQSPQNDADKVEVTSKGFGGRAQVTWSVATVGIDYAKAKVDYIDIQGLVDSEKSLDRWSAGAFADVSFWRNSIGLGYHRTDQKNVRGEHNTQDQAFVSYLYRLPIEGLSLKGVYGYARADVESADTGTSWSNNMNSVRIRILYQFN